MIGLYGGTFDPVHHAHLRVALEVLEQQQLQEIRFIPLHRPVHRGEPGANAIQRLEMLQIATAGTDGFTTDDRELLSNAPSYTLHTLQSFRAEFPHKQFALLLGGDAFNHFLDWHQPMKILALCNIIVMNRPGYRPNPLLDQLLQLHQLPAGEDIKNYPYGKIVLQQVTQLDISATAIRQQQSERLNIRYLVPDNVLDYIQKNKLYWQPGTQIL